MSDRSPAQSPAARPADSYESDAQLDASALDDTAYLAKLGYKQELNRAIGLFSSFGVQFSSIAVASACFTTLIVGLGFFGPASFWSWVIGGFFQVFIVGLAVGELVSAYPLAGGVYQINTRILSQSKNRLVRHPWLGWQSGWWIVLAHAVSVAAVAWSMVPYVAGWFEVDTLTNAETLWWALGIIAFVTLINVAGVRIAALANNIGVVAELVGAVLVVGALLFVSHDTQPASILNDTGDTVTNGQWLTPFLFAFLLPAYIISSFDSTGNAAEETRDAARKAPLGAFLANSAAWLYGILFIALLYLAIPDVDAVMGSDTPVKFILDSAVGTRVTEIFEVVAIVALVATCTMLQLTGVRVLWSQARDGQIPAAKTLRKVAANRIPVNATLVLFAMSVVFAVTASFSATALAVLAGLTSLAWALAYGVVVTSGLYGLLARKLPARPFNLGRLSPLVFVLAVAWSLLLVVVLIWQNPEQVGGGMLGAIVVGAVLYALIPKHGRPSEGASHVAPDDVEASA
ncbi:amino acid permease [Streptomyces scabiei]|uniref:APC family permease n=1 Tax=Streptomyces scabiei TaxID=1930 RepID=UPI001B3123F5|nr:MULTISPECIES: amino acid permease [Streptomyces]MBP5865998.1 amino acid permease [Streptomyces sp. LBUM 1484]MBP5873253.1 amino acid permease [Streptomyces sp. LBUM 1477]MBP5880935.1 amino acid permease [Streptomyces sp. LBUM 1487]MBP5896689.1 amino acid permease [Streptomyces sp. LBUM 1488]MDW8470301.1 amino acid permease [Streptomyces scabiei]